MDEDMFRAEFLSLLQACSVASHWLRERSGASIISRDAGPSEPRYPVQPKEHKAWVDI